jgi:hypothetical protein
VLQFDAHVSDDLEVTCEDPRGRCDSGVRKGPESFEWRDGMFSGPQDAFSHALELHFLFQAAGNFRRIKRCSGLALPALVAARGSVPLLLNWSLRCRASPRPPRHAAGPLNVTDAPTSTTSGPGVQTTSRGSPGLRTSPAAGGPVAIALFLGEACWYSSRLPATVPAYASHSYEPPPLAVSDRYL